MVRSLDLTPRKPQVGGPFSGDVCACRTLRTQPPRVARASTIIRLHRWLLFPRRFARHDAQMNLPHYTYKYHPTTPGGVKAHAYPKNSENFRNNAKSQRGGFSSFFHLVWSGDTCSLGRFRSLRTQRSVRKGRMRAKFSRGILRKCKGWASIFLVRSLGRESAKRQVGGPFSAEFLFAFFRFPFFFVFFRDLRIPRKKAFSLFFRGHGRERGAFGAPCRFGV